MLSMRGLPPFTVFFLKVFVVSFLLQVYFLPLLLLLSSLLRLGYYLRVSLGGGGMYLKQVEKRERPFRCFLLFLILIFFIAYRCFILKDRPVH